MSRYRMLPSYRYYEAEGESSITLENTAGKPLRDYRIYGNTVDGVSCGDKTKNLLDIRNGASKTERGITYTNNGDGTITFGGTFNSKTYTYYRLINLMTENFVSGETYTFGCGCEVNDTEKSFGIMVQVQNNDTSAYRYITSYATKTFTLAENETVTMFEFRTTIKTDVFPTIEPTLMTPFVYKGSYEPVYEPYGYKIPIVRKGTNIEPIAFNIYLDEPLRLEKTSSDNIDFGTQTIHRNIQRYEFDGTESWKQNDSYIYLAKTGLKYTGGNNTSSELPDNVYFTAVGDVLRLYGYTGTVDEWIAYVTKQYANGNPVWVQCAVSTTTKQSNIPLIPTEKNCTNIIEADTEVPPSKLWVEYYK